MSTSPTRTPPQDPPAIDFDEWKKETDPKLVEMFQKAFQGAVPFHASCRLAVSSPCARRHLPHDAAPIS